MDLHQTLLERGYEIPADELAGNVTGPGTTAAVRAFQAAHNLVIDGIAGPKTRAALADASRGLSIPSGWLVDYAGANSTARRALEIAAAEVGTREQPLGSNRGPRVDVYLTAGQTDARCYLKASGQPCPRCSANDSPQPECRGAPWCALFARWCYARAGVALPERGLQLASALRWMRWGELHGRIITAPRPGDLWLMLRGDDRRSGHCGIVSAILPDGRMATIEGNAGPGSAYVAALVRPVSAATAFVRVGQVGH